MSINNIELREGSAIAKLYNELKDGKVHKFSVVRAKFIKARITKKPYALALRLCLTLRRNKTGKMVELSKKTDTIQIVSFRAAGSKAVASKPVAHTTKKVVKKVVKKVPAVRTASAHNVKPTPTKKVPVFSGIEEE